MSLRLRLTLTYSLLVALIIGVFGIILYATMRQTLEAEMDRRLHVRAQQVQFTIFPGTISLSRADMTFAQLDLSPLSDLDAPGLYVQVLDREGNVLATSDSLHGAALPTDPTSVRLALEGQRVPTNVTVGENRAVRILSVPITGAGNIVGVLQVGQSRQPLQETMARLQTLLAVLGGAALGMAGLVGWLVAHHGLRALGTMSEQAAAIATRRDFSRRLHQGDRGDEVGQLAGTIDQLLATVEDTLRRHREFVADTSHELRNPLLAIRTNLELLDRVTDPEARHECVTEARQQVERMSRLVSELLLLAQVESVQVIERRPVALLPLVQRVVHEAEQRAAGQGVRLGAVEAIALLGDEGRLTQVLTNLVDNALKHTPAGGTVTVSMARQGDWVRLEVRDTGEGIAPEHLPHIFERFYRADPSRSRSNGSAGLGLAIVRHLTEAHGGWVTAESVPGHGTCFAVWLPLRPGLQPRQPLRMPVRL